MFFVTVFVAFIAFPQRDDAIFHHTDKNLINVEASGSIGLYHYSVGKCVQTHPNETIISSEMKEWCSNIASNKSDHPWIQYSVRGKQMKIRGYSVRNGCCRYPCCCTVDGEIIDTDCCCKLYSFSLQASNDNIQWTTIHKVEKDDKFYHCLAKEYKFEQETVPYTYIRLILDEEWPGCIRCLQINQIELYGEAIPGEYFPINDGNDEDQIVSIIGRLERGEQ